MDRMRAAIVNEMIVLARYRRPLQLAIIFIL
jgi:hypothetical protein